jgi:hypothetical protein
MIFQKQITRLSKPWISLWRILSRIPFKSLIRGESGQRHLDGVAQQAGAGFFIVRSGFMPSQMTAFTNPGVCK